MLSIIIPARNEKYLEPTIRDILRNASGEIEIIVELDGWLPDPQIHCNDNRVIFVHHKESIGQRQCVNHGARLAKGKYIMKCDAHCAFDKGFDVKLVADCEPSWTVIPRMYNLDVENWKPKLHKRTDYMYISSPTTEKPFRASYYTGSEYHRQHRKKALIDDTMACMGPCWFIHKDRFFEQGGCDEGHGSWGAMSVEVALKAWLSGGALKVNKKTWFAHYFRGGVGFPYHISGKDVEKARRYSQDLWLNDKWDKATRKLQWVVDKFKPPTWENGTTIIYYTSNTLKGYFERSVMKILGGAINKKPLISVSQKPMKFGKNICVGDIGRSNESIFRQILKGCESANTKYVALAESDCLYTEEHFNFIPPKDDVFYYNENNWYAFWNGDPKAKYSYVKRMALSQLICNRQLLIKAMRRNLDLIEKGFIIRKGKSGACEPSACRYSEAFVGSKEMWDKLPEQPEWTAEYFKTALPNIDIRHKDNLNQGKRGSRVVARKLPHWGRFYPFWQKQLMKRYNAFNYGAISFKIMNVGELHDNRVAYAKTGGEKSVEWFEQVFPPFVKQVHEGVTFTNEQLEQEPYFKYLVSKLNPKDRNPLTGKGKKRVFRLMRDAINVYHDIKENGLCNPLEGWREGKRIAINRGGRRVEMLWILGYKTVPVRIFKNKRVFELLSKSPKIVKDNSINSLGMKQFSKLQQLATDKYWIHQYLPLYDKHVSRDYKKVLEIGVYRGASLLLWKEAFPKAQIYGVDKDPTVWNKMLSGQDIKVMVGRQEDEDFLKREVIPNGKFDLIIDDGGHNPPATQKTFKMLWKELNPNGLYVIEDLCGNYRPDRIMMGTTVNALKDLIDELNLTGEVKSIHFYYNICFIQKGG